MEKSLLTFLILFITSKLFAQLPTTIYPITDFNEITGIDSLIEGKRIVLLGEQEHGDANAFESKTRIIQYLHEKKGFNVLVFESDFWSVKTVWEQKAYSFLRENIHNVWSKCNGTDSLFQYIEEQSKMSNPLVLQGIDCNHFQPFSINNYTQILQKQLENEMAFKEKSEDLKRYLFEIDRVIHETTFDFTRLEDTLNKESKSMLINNLDKLIQTTQHKDWKQEYINFKGLLEFRWNKDLRKRDETMTLNFLYLLNQKYPNEKFIVWGHNLHIAKENFGLQDVTLGLELQKVVSNQMVSIGFISAEGNFKRYNSNSVSIKQSKKESLESKLLTDNFSQAIIFLKPNQKFSLSGIFHNSYKKRDWSKAYDAIFYIREMKGCE